MDKLSHFDEQGQAHMVDVSGKTATRREAEASAFVSLSKEVLRALPDNPKGNPLEVARFAGIQAAKRTSDLIPMCHPLPLSFVDVSATVVEGGVAIRSVVATTSGTGVEMEALTAAAVAAQLCYGALGTDTGGSIRTPSSFCGTVGFKPTYGRVSNRNVIPLTWSLDHVGPITRSVEDTAIILNILAGYDALDLSSVNMPVEDYTKAIGMPVKGMRIGIPRASFYDKLDPDFAKTVEAAISS